MCPSIRFVSRSAATTGPPADESYHSVRQSGLYQGLRRYSRCMIPIVIILVSVNQVCIKVCGRCMLCGLSDIHACPSIRFVSRSAAGKLAEACAEYLSVRQSGLYQGLRRASSIETFGCAQVSVNQVCIKVCGAAQRVRILVCAPRVRQSGLYQGLRRPFTG